MMVKTAVRCYFLLMVFTLFVTSFISVLLNKRYRQQTRLRLRVDANSTRWMDTDKLERNTRNQKPNLNDKIQPPCAALPCAADCSVKMFVSSTSSVITVGGESNSRTMGQNAIIMQVLKPGLCAVHQRKEFNTSNRSPTNPFIEYLQSLHAGTVVIGLIAAGMTDHQLQEILPHLNAKLQLFGAVTVLDMHSQQAIAFVGMSHIGGGYAQYKLLDLSAGPVLWSTNTYIGQPMNLTFDLLNITQLEQRHTAVKAGRGWSPPDCQPQSTIAIIVPFRDRESHLRIFLNNIIPFLQRQNIAFHIFVIEQSMPELFNCAVLENAGFLEARKIGKFDCYVFHDVDLLPEDACNLYTCSDQPRHLSVAVNTLDYLLPYEGIFGGVIMLNETHMKQINGFSNIYFGWGGEDDNIGARVALAGYAKERYPDHIARYTMVPHARDLHNPESGRSYYDVVEFARYAQLDGLHNTPYKVKAVSHRQLFTHIVVSLVGPTEIKAADEYIALREGQFKAKFDKMATNNTRIDIRN